MQGPYSRDQLNVVEKKIQKESQGERFGQREAIERCFSPGVNEMIWLSFKTFTLATVGKAEGSGRIGRGPSSTGRSRPLVLPPRDSWRLLRWAGYSRESIDVLGEEFIALTERLAVKGKEKEQSTMWAQWMKSFETRTAPPGQVFTIALVLCFLEAH